MSEMKDVKVDVEELPEMVVAYVRHIGPYQGDSALFAQLWGKLMKWAGPRNLIGPDTKMMSIYYDDPDISDESRLKVDVCITVPRDTSVDGEVGKLSIPAGKYALAHFEIDADEYEKAWSYVFGQWLPKSGFQPDDRPTFELYRNNPEEHPQKKHIVDICVPVKPL
ncbi:MAG: GyrI-like domain-containing protein [Chitinispirillaceae bacterium]